MRIVLGSASPRRRELLAQIGLEFEVVVSDVEEVVSSVVPCEVVEELAVQKADGVLDVLLKRQDEADADEKFEGEMLIIGADTIVACDGQILGKPKDEEDARGMLRCLQGRAHEVYTGVTVLHVKQKKGISGNRIGLNEVAVEYRTFHEATKVVFCAMSEAEIESYVATGDPLDKAGAYGIQGLCARYISGIEGDYNNVVGLPVGRLYQEIKDIL